MILFVLLSFVAKGQEQFYKFPVVESGVYQINDQIAQSLGFEGIEAVGIFGNPGKLPQRLDSIGLRLNQVPTQIREGKLFFFLEGPHSIYYENGEYLLNYHHYADTLYYLLGSKTQNATITEATPSVSGVELDKLSEVHAYKWYETNLLSSGRNWYSGQMGNSTSKETGFIIQNTPLSDAELTVKVLNSSISTASFEFQIAGKKVGALSIPAIPNTLYGIKGREATFKGSMKIDAGESKVAATFQTNDPNGAGYLDYALLEVPLSTENLKKGIYFSSENGVITAKSNLNYYLVKDFYNVKVLSKSSIHAGDKLVLFDSSDVPALSGFQPINLNLRDTKNASLFIITTTQFLPQANRLAQHKNSIGTTTTVFELSDIYDNFSYGSNDVVGIRNFIAYHYHNSGQLSNVLFFGKGTFDYKNKLGGRPNIVPTYSSRNSLNPLTTFSSDDFFGLVAYGQGEWEESSNGDELLKIGVGRLPIITSSEANTVVSKLIKYELGIGMEGDWKRNLAFLADDGDNNIHLNDSESHSSFVAARYPAYKISKIYLDSFEKIRVGGIPTNPDAKKTLFDKLDEGLLILNYVGHGNETTLTAERVFNVSDLKDLQETSYLPLFVTATCEFGRQDSPFIRSGAEELLLAANKGAIAVLSTGRPVFSSINFSLNKAFIEAAFLSKNMESKDLGTIFKETKNNSLNGPLNRNFSLIGDPSLHLASPELEAKTISLMDLQMDMEADTLKSLQRVRLQGILVDPLSEAHVTATNGTYTLQVFDKPIDRKTLGQESSSTEYKEDDNLIFKGEGEVRNGEFFSEFILPKQISHAFGEGSIRVFAQLDNKMEAMNGQKIVVGGSTNFSETDTEGPKIGIRYGLEDRESQGIIASARYPITLFLEDKSGINISPQAVGQEIKLIINNSEPEILNSRYTAITGGFQKGIIGVELVGLKEGPNTFEIEAWDNLGNKSQLKETIEVRGSLQMKILGISAYPNPASIKSTFIIQHNRPNETILVKMIIYSMSGNKIYETSKRYPVAGAKLDDLEWNFFHNITQYPIKGTYIYELEIRSEKDGSSDRLSQKIIIQ